MNAVIKKICDKRLAMVRIGLVVFTIMVAAMVFRHIDLAPRVEENFFFSADDPRMLENNVIQRVFPGQSSLVVISVPGDIESSGYLEAIRELTGRLKDLTQTTAVKSLSDGPGDIQDAVASPLWRRLILSDDGKSTNILVFISGKDNIAAIRDIETAISSHESKRLPVKISGIPYIVEMVRRSLLSDLKTFSLIACVIFGFMAIVMFRSFRILIGIFLACANACLLTLVIANYFNIKIGILTANIITMIFVMTLSQIVFLTHNWMWVAASDAEGRGSVPKVLAMTFSASFWCMATDALGFASLLLVEAQPLRELGISGTIGTISAMTMAYVVYPAFLPDRYRAPESGKKGFTVGIERFFMTRVNVKAITLLTLCAILALGMVKLNTDPEIFAYFKKGGPLRNGIEYIDKNGGSIPLNIILRDRMGGKLTTRPNYDRLMSLQEDLESNESVGSIISLPIILAEGKRHALISMFALEVITEFLETPMLGSIAQKFITRDRLSTHFFIRMRESGRTKPRYDIIDSLKDIIKRHGFVPEVVSGLYFLQAELSNLLVKSMIKGEIQLIAVFFLIAYLASRSFGVSGAMLLCITVIPLYIFGIIGTFSFPIDIISAPAANVAIGLGIDSMIHMSHRYRLYAKDPEKSGDVWLHVKKDMTGPILGSVLIICAGFSIFLFSAFPPTQRFGLFVVVGSAFSALAALFIFPFIASIKLKA